TENGSCSIYDIVYTFRNNASAPFPNIQSHESVKALNMMKTLKEELSSDDEFLQGDAGVVGRLFNGSALFVKFWLFLKPTIDWIQYKVTPLPGSKIGVTGSIASGYNLGIIKGLEEDKRDAAIKVLEFISSEYFQKKMVINNLSSSSMLSLYQDEDVCREMDCNLYNNIQIIGRPNKIMYDYDEYSEKYRNYIYEYLYKDKSAIEVLKKVDDITKIYYISTDIKVSIIGYIEIILVTAIILIMLYSLIFLFFENYRPFFKYLTIDFWCSVMIGCSLILSICYTKIGMVTQIKCHLDFILMNYGLTFTYIPILYKLIVKFPDDLTISDFVKRKKYYFFICFIIIDTIFCGLSLTSSFNITTKIVEEGENFQICDKGEMFGTIIIVISYVFKAFIALSVLNKKNIKLTFINTVNRGFVDDNTSTNNKTNNLDETTQNNNITDSNYKHEYSFSDEATSISPKSTIFSKILSYHYTTDINEVSGNDIIESRFVYKTNVSNLYSNFGNAKIVLNAIGFARDDDGQIYTPIVNEFNKYAEKENLDIRIKLNLLTRYNTTYSVTDYGNYIDAVLKKKDSVNKYDLYFYDNVYLPNYGKYLMDLKNELSQEHINMYNQQIISESCIYDNKLVGLPVTLGFTVLYSNEKILNEYNKKIPKTWDELLETSKYILQKEIEKNNTDFLTYNGLFDYSEHGSCSIYEFIYSFRKSVNDPFPNLTSKEAEDALIMMKRIKEEASSDDYGSAVQLFEGKALFIKFWAFLAPTIYSIPYKMTPLPGVKEGISGASMTGYNLGILDGLKEEKRKAAIIAFKYMTSKEIQRKFKLENLISSGIPSLYDDEEICKIADCQLYKSLQPIGRPNNLTDNYDNYSEKYRNYIYEFLYGNKTAKEVLQEVEDITKIYYISYKEKDGVWIGCAYAKFGQLSSIKCHIEFLLFTIGFTFNFTPVFYKLINLFLNALLFIHPFEVKIRIIDPGKNFKVCSLGVLFIHSANKEDKDRNYTFNSKLQSSIEYVSQKETTFI
ncbi:hypothetical protein PIROE2DRAFT_2137, partial [Piromyces sp. E2]